MREANRAIVQELAEGITYRITPGHGYVELDAIRQSQMGVLALPYGSYEEDVECARVILVFQGCFDPEQVAGAHRTMQRYHPETYAAWVSQS